MSAAIVDHLAELTGFRDRDVLDVTLVGALRDLLAPGCVAIYRRVGDADDGRWLTRAHLRADAAAATSDPVWTDPASLPRLADHPQRQDCLQRQQMLALPGPPALTLFPLATDREVTGVLEFETDVPMTPEQLRTVASVLRVVRNFQALLDYSERDTLTGLLNRKTFDDAFLRSVAAAPAGGARRTGSAAETWLAVIDIDHFKRVNDNHGHLIGDEVLLLLSRLMRSSFRFNDQLYRFGGEEFVVLMRCGAAAEAMGALERLRGNVERYAFPRVGRVTVSIGCTEVRPGDSPTSAFERADRAVYFAKEHGRNNVADHATLVARGDLADTARDSDVELF